MLNRLEPVRRRLYVLLVPGVALLVFYGIVSETAAPLWIAALSAVLGVLGTESARSQVVPLRSLDAEYAELLKQARRTTS